MEHCPEHSGLTEQLKHICSRQDEMHGDIKKLLEPNGIYYRVSRLESFKGMVIKATTVVLGGGGVSAVVIKLLEG